MNGLQLSQGQLLQEARNYQMMAQPDRAEQLYQNILLQDSSCWEACYEIGRLMLLKKNFHTAIFWFKKAIILQPHEASSYQLMAKAYMAMQQNNQALKCIEKACFLDEKNSSFYLDAGLYYYQLGDIDQAFNAFEVAISLSPDNAYAHNNLGNIYKERKQLEAAYKAYQRAHQLNPLLVDPCIGLGALAQMTQDYQQGEHCYQQALRLQPGHPLALYNLGHLYAHWGHAEQAEGCWQQLLNICPEHVDAHLSLATLKKEQGQLEEAQVWLNQCLAIAPDHGTALHLLASWCGKRTQAAPSQYVKGLFDGYAEQFEQHLLGELDYRTPGLLKDAFIHLNRDNQKGLEFLLDLGCGTGLVADAFSGVAKRITGVDLSEKMVVKAREKAVYDRLVVDDITNFLRVDTQQYGCCIAADVLVYLGDLAAVFSGVSERLSACGYFVFSTERDSGECYSLQASGRYTHSTDYINRLALVYGFEVVYQRAEALRKEHDEWVVGDITLLKLSST